MTAALELAGVRKRFGDTEVLRGIDLTVADGEMFALVGINGAGKTTTIKSLLDFTSVDAGAIRIRGVTHRSAAARAPLYFLPERFTPPYFLSGEEFLRHAHRLHGVTFEPGQVDAVVDALELDRAALARPVRHLSKGMAQKLGLAAAFATGKPLLVLDEPMSGLDPKARILVKQRLAAEHTAGRTVAFTTHMLADAEALAGRMAILHAGRIVFDGTPAECVARHAHGADIESAFLNCVAAAGSAHA